MLNKYVFKRKIAGLPGLEPGRRVLETLMIPISSQALQKTLWNYI